MRLALALSLALATPLAAQEMTDAERDAFRAEVRAYLLENPEVIMEAVAILQQREEQEAAAADDDLVAQHADALFNEPTSYVGGNPDGDITVVEFIDYRFGQCDESDIPTIFKNLCKYGDIPLLPQWNKDSIKFQKARALPMPEPSYMKMTQTMTTTEENNQQADIRTH